MVITWGVKWVVKGGAKLAGEIGGPDVAAVVEPVASVLEHGLNAVSIIEKAVASGGLSVPVDVARVLFEEDVAAFIAKAAMDGDISGAELSQLAGGLEDAAAALEEHGGTEGQAMARLALKTALRWPAGDDDSDE